MADLKPFNGNDDLDVAADMVRVLVVDLAIKLVGSPHFKTMPPSKQIEAFICGTMTAALGVAFSIVIETTEAHDEIERFVAAYIPQARAQAEGIAASGERLNG